MDKNKLVYMFLLIGFVVFILILDVSFYIKNSNINGKLSINRKFYEINYISDNNNIRNNKNTLNIISNGIDKVYFDIYNSGNENAYLSEYSIYGITTTLENEEDLVIDTSLKKNDVIKGGQTKRVYVNISCDECNFDDNTVIDFKLKYLFKE